MTSKKSRQLKGVTPKLPTDAQDGSLGRIQKDMLQAEETLIQAPVTPIEKTEKRQRTTASTALLASTIQKLPREQLSIFEVMEQDQKLRKEIRINNIEEIGANLTASGWRALIAIARLASTGGHYQRTKESRDNGKLRLEDIVISQKDFFKAYGANRIARKRQLDYAPSDMRDALQGLAELTKPIAQVYSQKAQSGRKGRRDVIRTVAPLATYKELYLDVTTKEEREITEGDISGKGLKYLRISPSEIFYHSSFIDLPEALYSKIEELEGKRAMTPTLYKTIVILALENHRDPDNTTLRRRLDKYLANTGKAKLLETRQSSRAVKETDKELSKLKRAGAVKEHRYEDELSGRFIEIDIDPEGFK